MSLTGLLLLVLAQQPPGPAATVQLPRRPDLRGRTYAAAEEILRRFRITVVTRDSLVREGRLGVVLAQYPSPGTPIRPGSVDTLVLSWHGPTDDVQVRVPDVVGRPYREAVRLIRGARLVAQGPVVNSADSATALVVAQKPNPLDPALPGSAVQLDVRLEVRVQVPSLVGRDSATARESIQRARLRARPPDLDYDDNATAGVVTHQDPPAGESVKPGTSVRIRVSRGPHPDTTLVVMPRLLNLGVERARAAVERARLVLSHIDSVPQSGGAARVIAQEPHAGDTVHIGDAVRITLTAPQRTVMVPPLIGRSRSQAEDTLRRLGLEPAPIGIVADPVAPDGIVMRQSALPGTFLLAGQSVGLEVNARPVEVPVIVPRLVGLGLEAATETIVARHLTVRGITRRAGADNIVLSQAPGPGTSVARGAGMELSVGRDDPGDDAPPPPPPLPVILVPDVRDSPVATAVAVVRPAGFVNLVVDSAAAPGPVLQWTIAAQAPAPGARVRPQTLVRLTATGAAGVPTPHLVDRNPDDAALEARSANLRMQVVDSHVGLRLVGSVVRTQVPAADVLVAPGTPISVTIANPIPFVVSAGAGIAGLALATGVGVRKGWIKPAVRVRLEAEPPALATPEHELIETELRVTVEFEPLELSVPDGIILREEPYHE